MVEAANPKPQAWWRRWFAPRFSLRALLILTTVVAVVLGTWVTRARRQAEICAELERIYEYSPFIGGWGFVSWNAADPWNVEDKTPPPWWFTSIPSALRDDSAEHYWRTVDAVEVKVDYRRPDDGLRALELASRLPGLGMILLSGPNDPRRFDELNRMTIEERQAYERIWSAVGSLKTLQRLEVDHVPIDDFAMERIVELPRLGELELSDSQFDNKVLRHLAKASTLKKLDLSQTAFDDEGAVHVGALTRLESLSIDRTQVTSKGIRRLEGLTNLRELDVARLWIDDESASSVAKLVRLESLVAYGVRLSDEGFAAMLGSRELKHVNFAETRAGRRTFVALSELPKLEQIVLARTRVGDRYMGPDDAVHWQAAATELIALLRRPGFVRLELGRTSFTRDELLALSGAASKATELRIDFIAMTRDDWRNLGGSPTLEKLHLIGHPDLGDALAEIAKIATLRELTINDSPVTDADLAAIGRMQGLERLAITSGKFTDDGFANMASLPNLVSLKVRLCPGFGDRSLAAVAAWPGRKVRGLDLEGTSVTDASLDVLKGLGEMDELNLGGSKLTLHAKRSLHGLINDPDLKPELDPDPDPFDE